MATTPPPQIQIETDSVDLAEGDFKNAQINNTPDPLQLETEKVRKIRLCEDADKALSTLYQLQRSIEVLSSCLKDKHNSINGAEGFAKRKIIDDSGINELEKGFSKIFRFIHEANKTNLEMASNKEHPLYSGDFKLPIRRAHSFIMTGKINKINDLITGMTAVGYGGEGRVFRGRLRGSRDPVVVKSYFMDCEHASRIEFAMMTLAKNVAGVKKAIGLINTQTNYFLIIEDDLNSVPLDSFIAKEKLSDVQIQCVFSQMSRILKDLSQKYIKHRDVKLGNFLLDAKNWRISIIDFGWSMYSAIDKISVDEVRRSGESLMGSPEYLPPENNSPLGTIVSYEKATVYALGCILLELFFGYHGNLQKIMPLRSISMLISTLTKKTGRRISSGAKNLLDKCTRSDQNERLSLEGILRHPWVLTETKDLKLKRSPLMGSNQNFKSFEI